MLQLNLPSRTEIANARLPMAYEAAIQALANCASIDECRDWSDKAAALASYAKQADDDRLQKHAMRIHARAVRRLGELLRTFQTSPQGGRPPGNGGGAPPVTPASQRQAAARVGLSKDQERTAARVANVPAATFERLVESDTPPTVTKLAEIGTRPSAEPPRQSTQLLGIIRRFATFCVEQDPERVAHGVVPADAANVRQLVGTIDAWLDRFVVNVKG